MTQIIYNNANAEERTKQLRNAKVEESRIQEWSKTQFENLPATFVFINYTKSHDGYYLPCM
jgi:hypothetical protein